MSEATSRSWLDIVMGGVLLSLRSSLPSVLRSILLSLSPSLTSPPRVVPDTVQTTRGIIAVVAPQRPAPIILNVVKSVSVEIRGGGLEVGQGYSGPAELVGSYCYRRR